MITESCNVWYSSLAEMRMAILVVAALTLLLMAAPMPALAQTDWEVVKTFQIGGQSSWDYLTVDPTKIYKSQAFASCRDGTLAVAGETPAGKFAIVQTVKTPQGARTMGMDPTTRKIYLPTAEFEEPRPGAAGRPRMKPGTFMIVVVAHHAEQ